jgi:hypothetical protein
MSQPLVDISSDKVRVKASVALWPGGGSDHSSPRDRHVLVPMLRVAAAFKGIPRVSEMPDWKG